MDQCPGLGVEHRHLGGPPVEALPGDHVAHRNPGTLRQLADSIGRRGAEHHGVVFHSEGLQQPCRTLLEPDRERSCAAGDEEVGVLVIEHVQGRIGARGVERCQVVPHSRKKEASSRLPDELYETGTVPEQIEAGGHPGLGVAEVRQEGDRPPEDLEPCRDLQRRALVEGADDAHVGGGDLDPAAGAVAPWRRRAHPGRRPHTGRARQQGGDHEAERCMPRGEVHGAAAYHGRGCSPETARVRWPPGRGRPPEVA